uniref:Uncharacterized protein n=1 Tax=Rangifer tarandus platyrhynchus TaxID=3082113 RepID=A0ACB0EZ58_RANTA|nr:unnamed protein product [Rangifer tarandus platyrhynchus]
MSTAGPAFPALPGSRVLRKDADSLGTRLVPFPGLSSSGAQVSGECAAPGGHCPSWACVVITPASGRSVSGLRRESAVSVRRASPPGS